MKNIQIVPVMDCIVLKGDDYKKIVEKIADYQRKMKMLDHLTGWLKVDHPGVFDDYKRVRAEMVEAIEDVS